MSKESRAKYYEKAFDRLEKTGKHTWNWAAFFGGFSWMGYRKIYLLEMVFSFICGILYVLSWTGMCLSFMGRISVPWGVFLTLFVLLFLVKRIGLGRYGNSLYYWTVKKRISRGYHLLNEYRPTSIVAIICPIILWIADALSNEIQLDKLNDNEVSAETIHAYLDPNKKNHWIVKTANVLVFVLWLFAVIFVISVDDLNNVDKLSIVCG